MVTSNAFGKSRLEQQCEAIEKELLDALDEKTPAELADWVTLQLYWTLAELRIMDQTRAKREEAMH